MELKTRVVLTTLLCSWVISIVLAGLPTLTSHHRFYSAAVVRDELFFDSVLLDFNGLLNFMTRLMKFHPGFQNMTAHSQDLLLKSDSWNKLVTSIQNRYNSGFKPDGYFG